MICVCFMSFTERGALTVFASLALLLVLLQCS